MSSKSIYCVYFTVYRGNKMPMFYIGSTSVENIRRGYHGSVNSKKYKLLWREELKHSAHLFHTVIISTHELRTSAYNKEKYLQEHLNVKNSSMYINEAIALKRNSVYTKDSITGTGSAKDCVTGLPLGRVKLNDPRWKSGEIVGRTKGQLGRQRSVEVNGNLYDTILLASVTENIPKTTLKRILYSVGDFRRSLIKYNIKSANIVGKINDINNIIGKIDMATGAGSPMAKSVTINEIFYATYKFAQKQLNIPIYTFRKILAGRVNTEIMRDKWGIYSIKI